MPLSTAAKAALCLCPPAVMAGSVATVPAVKRAVHHLTAEHRPHRPINRMLTAAAHPAGQAARHRDCLPVAAPVLQPAVPLVTYAAPIPAEPVGHSPIAGPAGGGLGGPVAAVGVGPVVGAVAPVGPGGTTGGTGTGTTGGTTGGTGAVPEPASWLMLILGAGALGATLRRRRRPAAARAVGGAALWSGGAVAVEAGDVAGTVAVKSAVASAAGKAMLCVCPAAVVAGSVVAVPPVRHAVHAVTAPVSRSAPVVSAATPCAQPMAVPVSATSIGDYPAVVSVTPRPS